jgi:hypothetical protein
LTTCVVQELSCYAEENLSEERDLIELGETKCRPAAECSLAAALKSNPEVLKALKDAVEAQPSKPENTKRAKALKELIRLPKQKLTDQQCRHLGDAIFAFFCPSDAVILTTNLKDIQPLAKAVNKEAVRPTDRLDVETEK